MMNDKKFKALIQQLYKTVEKLENMFKGRHFTLDGHLVGSIGECFVADTYNLKLMTAGTKGYDAVTTDGKKVEIKTTQIKSQSVGFSCEPDFVIVIQISLEAKFKEIYNGPGVYIWEQFSGRKKPSNNHYSISLTRLKELNKKVSSTERIKCKKTVLDNA